MFMQPIDHPVIRRSRRRRVAFTLFVGVLSIAAMGLIMVLWWLATAVWLPCAAAARIVRSAVRGSYECALFAGEAVIGR